MSNLTLYFERRAYQPTWFLGDRVTGKWNKIPFVGKVGVDNILTTDQKSRVVIILDLPLRHNNKYFNTITVTHKDIKLLKNPDLELQKTKAK